jgi:hypothetical protein
VVSAEELVGLAVFDDHISSEDKRRMVEQLDVPDRKGLKGLEKKNFPPTVLYDCITVRTRKIFDGVLPNGQQRSLIFLAKAPSTWEDDATYQEFSDAVKDLTVVSDTAERAVTLATKFNNCLTRTESKKQYLL